MISYLSALSAEFDHHRNPAIAAGQEAYMRHQFRFFGIKTPIRREIQKPFLDKHHLPKKEDIPQLIRYLWRQPEREFQLFAQELMSKYAKNFEQHDIVLLEFMITHKSWWDTVDFIADKLAGQYFRLFPQERHGRIEKWLDSDDIWLQRSALLFQLKYKDNLDTQLLSYCIHRLQGSDEFFINKAIGWILREYAKTNPQWVSSFVHEADLHPLSKREAIRRIAQR